MAQRGRKPKPIGAKRVAGNPGKRSLTPTLPDAPDGPIPMPDSVGKLARAKGYWDLFLRTAGRGHLRPMDGPLLGRLCMALALADEATDELLKVGSVIRAPNTGLPIQNPFMPVVNRQTEIARKLAAELGLTVAQRNRTGGAGDGGDEGGEFFDA